MTNFTLLFISFDDHTLNRGLVIEGEITLCLGVIIVADNEVILD